ncbi:MAG: NADH-quinone oxidoreductase subunit N [Deltaproteobacteria bacterium]|nr:NADH-quinone oxidoreductase subunit N [Deltaproteobacteria bacterium]
MPHAVVLFSPELTLAGMAVVFFAFSLTRSHPMLLQAVAMVFALMALITTTITYATEGVLFAGVYRVDAFSQTFKILISLGMLLVLWLGSGLRGVKRSVRPEYYFFFALSCLGLMMMCSATELLTILLSLEISSFAVYILIPLRFGVGQRAPLEAGIKYILFGLVATGITLYGMSYLFGLTGTTDLVAMMEVLPRPLSLQPLALIGLVMMLCGIFYKLALFPMHFWMPDIFVGAAHETTAFVATIPKIAATALLIRVVSLCGPSEQLTTMLAIMAVVSMTLGNLLALAQDDVKRLLAYSSIAHAGYLIIGVLCIEPFGLLSAMYYVYGYLWMSLACFFVIYNLSDDGRNIRFCDLRGLYKRSPIMAGVLVVGAIGLAGLPPTIGFTGKFMIFAAALKQQHYWLVSLAVFNVCISAFYYLRLVRAAYSNVEQETDYIELSAAAKLLGILIIIAIIVGGLLPQNFLSLARDGLAAIMP